MKLRQELTVKATADDGKTTEFKVICRIDTPAELDYYRHGGILEYVLRQLLAELIKEDAPRRHEETKFQIRES